MSDNSFGTRSTLEVGDRTYTYYSLTAAEAQGLGNVSRLPVSLKVLLENLLRFEDGSSVHKHDIERLASWSGGAGEPEEIAFRPARAC